MVANSLLPLKQKAQVRRHKTVRVELSRLVELLARRRRVAHRSGAGCRSR